MTIKKFNKFRINCQSEVHSFCKFIYLYRCIISNIFFQVGVCYLAYYVCSWQHVLTWKAKFSEVVFITVLNRKKEAGHSEPIVSLSLAKKIQNFKTYVSVPVYTIFYLYQANRLSFQLSFRLVRFFFLCMCRHNTSWQLIKLWNEQDK